METTCTNVTEKRISRRGRRTHRKYLSIGGASGISLRLRIMCAVEGDGGEGGGEGHGGEGEGGEGEGGGEGGEGDGEG